MNDRIKRIRKLNQIRSVLANKYGCVDSKITEINEGTVAIQLEFRVPPKNN